MSGQRSRHGHGVRPAGFGRRRSPHVGTALAVEVLLLLLVLAPLPRDAGADSLFLQVDTPAVTLNPGASDYARDYAELTGISGIRLKVKTTVLTGMSVLFRCSDPAPRIALSDLMVRTPTPPGLAGASLSSFTPVAATNQFLWSSGLSIAPFFYVYADVRIRNLIGYDDAPGGSTTSYTNTLTFTVVSP